MKKECSAILLTNDISKNDWLDENKEQYTHYIENAYANTEHMIYILSAKDIFGISYENIFEEHIAKQYSTCSEIT